MAVGVRNGRMQFGDETTKIEKQLGFVNCSAIIHAYSHPNDFKITPGDLGQARDQPRINPGQTLDEGRMTPRWTWNALFMVLLS